MWSIGHRSGTSHLYNAYSPLSTLRPTLINRIVWRLMGTFGQNLWSFATCKQEVVWRHVCPLFLSWMTVLLGRNSKQHWEMFCGISGGDSFLATILVHLFACKTGFRGCMVCLALNEDSKFVQLAECPPYGQVPWLSQASESVPSSFELSAQVATEAGCYNDGRV